MRVAGGSIARRKWSGGYFYMLRVGSTDIYKLGMTVKSPEFQARRYNAGLYVCGVRKNHSRNKLLEVVNFLFVRDVERCRWLETMMKREIYPLRINRDHILDYSRKAHAEWFTANRSNMKKIKDRLRFYVNRLYTKKTGAEIEDLIARRPTRKGKR